jgi:hypothetical protein
VFNLILADLLVENILTLLDCLDLQFDCPGSISFHGPQFPKIHTVKAINPITPYIKRTHPDDHFSVNGWSFEMDSNVKMIGRMMAVIIVSRIYLVVNQQRQQFLFGSYSSIVLFSFAFYCLNF